MESEKDIFARYAKTSHLLDIDFFLHHCNGQAMTREDRREWLALRARAPRMAKPKVVKAYRLLLSRYWRTLAQLERALVQAPRFIGGHYADEHGTFRHGWRDTLRGDTVFEMVELNRRKIEADTVAA
jgi:hypothetical protein